MKPLAIVCPITSRGCSDQPPEQPVFHALLPSMDLFNLWEVARVYFAHDADDPLWARDDVQKMVDRPVTWLSIEGQTGKITTIWNYASALASDQHEYLLPANDDMAFLSDPTPAIDVVRDRNGFGTCAFADASFPGWPTFYVVGRMHFAIFGALYPLPWQGAHQDPWIADIYRPWGASEIDQRIRVHNRMGSESSPVTGPRFEYGDATNYRGAVMNGRRAVNAWLQKHRGVARPLDEETLCAAPMLL